MSITTQTRNKFWLDILFVYRLEFFVFPAVGACLVPFYFFGCCCLVRNREKKMKKDRLESVPLETVDDGQVPCSPGPFRRHSYFDEIKEKPIFIFLIERFRWNCAKRTFRCLNWHSWEKMLNALTRLLLFGSTPVDSGVVMVTTIRQCGHREWL